MRTLLRKTFSRISRSTGSWLTLVLLLVVLVPSLCLLWFMNQAMQNERLAVRQKLVDAYRVQLNGAQEKVEANWKKIDDEVQAQRNHPSASAHFAHVVSTGAADAVVIFNPDRSIAYPNSPDGPRTPRPDPAWIAAQALESSDKQEAAEAYGRIARQAIDANLGARALQAQARCLFQVGAADEAVAVIEGPLQEARFAQGIDPQSRLVVPNAELLGLEFLHSSRPDAEGAIFRRLRARVLDYEHSALSSGQRRFIMHELQRWSPDPVLSQFLAAEVLAEAYMEARAGAASAPVTSLRRSTLPGVWEHVLGGGGMVMLHRTEGLSARLKEMIAPTNLPADVRIDFLVPGEEKETALLLISAGPTMPGWRLALSLDDAPLSGAAAREGSSSYRWIGLLMVFTVVVLALLAWGLVRRQVALTELRNDLVANVTHELKTPLASMRLLVETLLNTPKWNEQTAREYLQLIATENLRLSRLIGNFLTFSRIERNKYAFHFEDVSAQTIVDAAVAAAGDRFQGPACRFEVVSLPYLPQVSADADALVTALVNLLDNAWKYSGEAKHVVLTSGVRDSQVYWSVRDNGIGLSPRDTKRIFQRFQQVHPHLSRTGGGGCGLGLSIVQFIVEAHRGTVGVVSEPGRGSTFTLTLPSSGANSLPKSAL